MMMEFRCLKLEQSTVEAREMLPEVGAVLRDFQRWPGKVFTVASVDTQRRPHPLVMVRLLEPAAAGLQRRRPATGADSLT